MKLFKNGVGRPSAETLRKRKIFYIAVTIAATILITGTSFVVYHYASGISGGPKNATTDNCRMPYSSSKCKSNENATIKEVQKMLEFLGYYEGNFNGKFDSNTIKAVKKFQKEYDMTVDGYIGPQTLEELAKATDTDYFKVKYNKNGGSGNLNSQYNDIQTIIKGISTPISSTILTKSGKTHVGYTGTVSIKGTKYKYGCFNANCVAGNQSRYSVDEIEEREDFGEKFYNYVYPIGTNLKNTAKNEETITLKAYYCSSNQKYNQKTSKCVKNSTTSSGSYNISGQLTGYSVKCSGCDGRGYVGCANNQHPFTTTKYHYEDPTYGKIRVVAASSNYKCGSIIEIQSYNEGTTTKKAVKAIVLDRGVSGNVIDLLVSTNDFATKNIGRQNIKFKVIRNGW